MKRYYIFLSTIIFFSYSLIRAQDIGIDFYRHLSNFPYLYPNVESYYESSYDRTGGNDDGFRGTYSQLYEDENGDHVIFDANGPGCIYNMWGTGPEKIPNWGKIKLYFDGEKKPRLEMDANDLFSGLYKPFIFPLINHQYVSSGGFSSCVLFPFVKNLKITTEKKVYFYNIYYQLYKDVDIRSWNPEFDYTDIEIGYTSTPLKKIDDIPVGYFGAKYQRTWPITDKDDYILFDFKGRGAVVGQVMTVEPVKPDVKQWWEGDMRIIIDGEKKPRFHGTGHEDEYQGGWSNFWMSNPYSLPLYGLPKSTGLINISGQINGSVTAYRFWPGKIPFKKSIRISTEHGTENNRSANYSSLVYYYFCNE